MLVEKGANQTREDVLGDGSGNAESQFARELTVRGVELPLGFCGQKRDFLA